MRVSRDEYTSNHIEPNSIGDIIAVIVSPPPLSLNIYIHVSICV